MTVPQRVEITDGAEVKITWEDGREDVLAAATLRSVCPCAGCREPEGAQAATAVLAGEVPVTIADARFVGGYALAFTFMPDGHHAGIYPFDALRRLGDPRSA